MSTFLCRIANAASRVPCRSLAVSKIFVARAVHRAPSCGRTLQVSTHDKISGRRFFAAKARDDEAEESKVSEDDVIDKLDEEEEEAPVEKQKKGRRMPTEQELQEGKNPVPLYRILAQETKDLMFKLHTDDPVKNSVTELATRFGISHVRVSAVLTLSRLSAEQDARGLTEEEAARRRAGMELQQVAEEVLGTVRTGFSSPLYTDEREGFEGIVADVQERGIVAKPKPHFETYSYPEARRRMDSLLRAAEKRKAEARSPRVVEDERLARAASAQIPVPTMLQVDGVEPRSSRRWKYVFADISAGITGETRLVTVRDTDGTLRAAQYEERLRVERHLAPPRLPRK